MPRRYIPLVILMLTAACRTTGDAAGKFETASVERGPIAAKVTATGTLSALVTVQVGSQVSGRIEKLFADYNSEVRKGELIALIDPELFKAAVENAEANLVQMKAAERKAEVDARLAKLNYERIKSLLSQHLMAQSDLDTAQATYEDDLALIDEAKGNRLQAEAALHTAQANLKYTSIYSPIDGTVISRSVDVGQTVAASLQAPTLFTIAEDLRKMQVDTSVSEADIGKLRDHQKATFSVDAYPGERFEGTVRQIRNAATSVQNVVTYDVVIDVANPDLKLRPGMTANVELISDRREDALKVSAAAFRFRPPPELLPEKGAQRHPPRGENGLVAEEKRDDRKPLWVLRDGKPHMMLVTQGISDGKFTEIVGGELQEGDAVITAWNGPVAQKPGGISGGMMRRF